MAEGSIFRSEAMRLCQIFFPNEVTYSSVARLGELGCVQFVDMNPSVNAFQRKFVNEVRRCEEMERRLRFFATEIKKDDEASFDDDNEDISFEAPRIKDMLTLEGVLEKLEHDLKEVISNKDAMNRNMLELVELNHILRNAQYFFDEYHSAGASASPVGMAGPGATVTSETVLNLERGDQYGGQAMRLGFLTGIINRDKMHSFELLIWRMCRGNAFLKMIEIPEAIDDPQTGQPTAKAAFIIFFQGDQLKLKCKRICEGLNATIYPCPDSAAERADMAREVNRRLEELSHIIAQSNGLRRSLIENAAQSLHQWNCKVKKMKAIFHVMNLFNHDPKRAIAECWVPLCRLGDVRAALEAETKAAGTNAKSIINFVNTTKQPPTYNKVNKFTAGFQNIVNAYGIASYGEINPAPFTVITFPFLFALMFGDLGHGIIMFLAAFYMVRKEKELRKKIKGNEVLEIFYGGRYIILLMGLFSIYAGFIYNDVFAKSLNLFGSSWRVGVGMDFPWGDKATSFFLYPNPYNDSVRMYSGSPYPMGVDPVWLLAANKITYTNTMKMKFAVIIGVSQMIFGLCLSYLNHKHRKDKMSILFEFIPQLIFITLIFGYLCLLIIIKWIKYYGNGDDHERGTCAPNLLIELINMFFLKDSAVNPDGGIDPCKRIYPGQVVVQRIFLFLSVICIPVMLLVKPLYRLYEHKKKTQGGCHHVRSSSNGYQSFRNPTLSTINGDEDAIISEASTSYDSKIDSDLLTEKGHGHEEEEEEFDFSEIFVEQTIHTIEYFLGCVSHTASYLRLWALSLAHAELSDVLWTMLFRMGLKMKPPLGSIMLFNLFISWAGITVGILVMMEGLSAFLHALRLHWVEFQSKFYKGDGYLFEPFSFEQILENSDL